MRDIERAWRGRSGDSFPQLDKNHQEALFVLLTSPRGECYNRDVKRLDVKQKEFLAEFFNKISLMAAAALIFGQFVPGQTINWWVIVGGAFVVGVLITYALSLKKQFN